MIEEQEKMLWLVDIIKRVKIDTDYLYDSDKLADEKIGYLANNCSNVLDFGKSSRKLFELFDKNQIITSDICQYDSYPDIIDDICNIKKLSWQSFDGIICLAILEHVYAPHAACDNLYKLLKKDGHAFVYVPFLYNYHASEDLHFQDYFRFSRDGIAYLFKDFSEVTIYPYRGRYSSIFNLIPNWNKNIEKRFGDRPNKFIDKFFGFIFGGSEKVLQASGYFIWVKK